MKAVLLVIALAVIVRPILVEAASTKPMANIPRKDGKGDKPEIRKTMADFSRCLLDRASRTVPKYFAAFPMSQRASEIAQNLVDNNRCLFEGSMRMQDNILRGALYEAAYRRDYANRPLPPIAKSPQIDYVQGAKVDDKTGPQIALRLMADCIVRAAPEGSRALILSDLSTEKQAFTAVVPHIDACIPQGKTISFSPSILRGLIAETLYRLSAATVGPLGFMTTTLSTKDRLNA